MQSNYFSGPKLGEIDQLSNLNFSIPSQHVQCTATTMEVSPVTPNIDLSRFANFKKLFNVQSKN